MNSFGQIFRVTTFGESHGPALGGIIDGMPAGVAVDMDYLQSCLDRRRPGQSSITTSRREADRPELLSGVSDGVTTGTPIGFIVRNSNARSADYDEMATLLRPSHADYTYMAKYGLRDHRGGGRSSARETLARVVGGAFAMMALRTLGVEIHAFTSQVGDVALPGSYADYDLSGVDSNAVRCPDADTAARMERLIMEVKNDGDTIGGTVTCVIKGCPPGLGEPVGDKLSARLASAMMSINAAKGFDYGSGFDGLSERGSRLADRFAQGVDYEGRLHTLTNHSGGIQGGISNGEDIYFRVAFKAVATLMRDVETVDLDGRPATLHARGRHDPCVLPRAVPVVEAMAAITLLDLYLLNKTTRW